jgi:hypothetical protein
MLSIVELMLPSGLCVSSDLQDLFLHFCDLCFLIVIYLWLHQWRSEYRNALSGTLPENEGQNVNRNFFSKSTELPLLCCLVAHEHTHTFHY